MNKKIVTAILALTMACGARTWTDQQGRTIEAEMIDADDTGVRVKKKDGKEFRIPLDRLSKEDADFVKAERSKERPGGDVAPEVAPRGGPPAFDGKPLVVGGKMNVFEYAYDRETLRRVSGRLDGKDTGFKIAIAVPNGFDPSKPQKVFVPLTPVNDEVQARGGNFRVFGMYAPSCLKQGWATIAFDSNLGYVEHDAAMEQAFAKLLEQWPQMKTWEFATGGFSGGAKACQLTCAYLVKEEFKVVGMFLGGCGRDRTDEARSRYRAKSRGYKSIKVFCSGGKEDEIAPPEMVEALSKSLRKGAMKEVRMEWHDGAHDLCFPHIEAAVKWFGEADRPRP